MTIRKKIEVDLNDIENQMKQFDITDEMKQEFDDLVTKAEALKAEFEKLKASRKK